MSNKILSNLNIGNNSYEIDDAFARQKIEEVNNNLLKINPVYSTSGSVVSFNDGADNLPLDELIVDINPVQDLHGYDNPWPAGGGINKLNIAEMSTSGSTYGFIMTIDGEDFVFSGTYTGTVDSPQFMFAFYTDFREILYKCKGFAVDTITAEHYTGFVGRADNNKRLTIQFHNCIQGETYNFRVRVVAYEGDTVPTSWTPYSNVCPISGHDSVSVWDDPAYGWTIRWGQSFPLKNVSYTGNNFTVKSSNDGAFVVTVTATASGTTASNVLGIAANTFTAGHIYAWIGSKDAISLDLKVWSIYTDSVFKVSKPAYSNIAFIFDNLPAGTYNVYPMLFDLTEVFGEAKAEEVLAMGSSAGAVYVKSLFPKDYYDYDISYGETCVSAVNGNPYRHVTIQLGDTVYGGSLDITTGVLTVDRAIVDIDNLTKNGYTGYGGWYYMDKTFSVNANNRVNVSCNLLQVKNSHSSSKLGVYCEGSVIYFEGVSVAGIANSLTECTDWVKQSNIELILPLANPITYQLTPHEVKSLLGQNNIFTNINSNNILVSYKADMQKCIDNKLNIDEIAYKTTSIPYGQVDATSTSTNFTATIDGITELRDGVCVILKNGVVTSASGFTININNLGAKPVYSSMAASTRETTVFNSAYTIMLIYSTSLNNGDGGWWFYRGYNSDTNTTGYVLRTNSMSLPVSSHTHRYRLLFTSADGTHFVPANNDTADNTTAIKNVCQEKIDPFGTIRYYNGSVNLEAEGIPSGSTIWEQNTFSLGYSFNHVGGAINLAIRKPVYIKALPQSDGSAIIDADEAYVQDLPITEDGKIYIYLGVAYNTTSIELSLHHPVYHYRNGAIQLWTGPESFTDDYKNKIDILWTDYQSRIGQ